MESKRPRIDKTAMNKKNTARLPSSLISDYTAEP